MGFDVSPFLVSLTAVQGFTAANRLLLSVGLSCFIRPGLVRLSVLRLLFHCNYQCFARIPIRLVALLLFLFQW